MDRKIKERLIGLVVLLTLAVIFLPMFLGGPDESGERRHLPLATETEESLPETRLDLNGSESGDSGDQGRVSTADSDDEGGDGEGVTVSGLDESSAEAEPVAESDVGDASGEAGDAASDETEAVAAETDDAPSESAGTSGDATSADAGTDEPETESSAPEPSPEPADDGGESAGDESSATEADADTDDDAVPAGSGWAAQVGSFTRRDNADDLIGQLRDEGFEAFLMRHRTDERTFYRVRVGLEPDRESAAALAERIRRETGHEAAPVPHP